jgi:hypothetical protein
MFNGFWIQITTRHRFFISATAARRLQEQKGRHTAVPGAACIAIATTGLMGMHTGNFTTTTKTGARSVVLCRKRLCLCNNTHSTAVPLASSNVFVLVQESLTGFCLSSPPQIPRRSGQLQ